MFDVMFSHNEVNGSDSKMMPMFHHVCWRQH